MTSTHLLLAAILLVATFEAAHGLARGIFLFHHDKFETTRTWQSKASAMVPTTLSANDSTSVKHGYENSSDMTVLDYNYKYYQQTVLRAEKNQTIDWIDLNAPPSSSSGDLDSYQVMVDPVLSRNYLHSRLVWLKFKFPFYGHMIDRILVTNVGFIYAGTLLSPYISKAQYIAPLMANFDVTLSPNSSVKYLDNSTHFVCTWEKLRLMHQPELGEYTFQVVVGIDGKIVFNYLSIPSNISDIVFNEYNETVKIGLSDAYMDYKLYIDYFNTDSLDIVAEYGLVQVKPHHVKSGNSIILFMLKNCFQQSTCDECVRGVPNFECIWCASLQRCSDTYAVEDAEWKHSACPETAKGQTSLMCQGSSHLKIDVGFRPDWIGAESEVHRSLIKSMNGDNNGNGNGDDEAAAAAATFNMTLLE